MIIFCLLPPGRHWLNISDIVVSGEFREWKEGSTKSVVLYPGNKACHFTYTNVFSCMLYSTKLVVNY